MYTQQALKELGIVSLLDIKNFYLNDIINYHQETYKKVYKFYEQFKLRKFTEKEQEAFGSLDSRKNIKNEGEIKLDEFIKENDL